MDQFDALTNNQLRDELKSRGLGNFPVTDTTRNALVKKLRNAVNGTTTAKPIKNRRETMNAVVKRSTPDESESDADAKKSNKPTKIGNRRATIGTGAAPAASLQPVVVLNGVIDDKVKPVPVRQKSPSRPKSPSRRTIAPVEPISYFADASDDDLVAAAEEAEKKAVTRKTRTSRSPSLSKSSVVTTSYKHTIEPLYEQNDDVIVLNDNSDAEYSSEMLEKVRKPVTPTSKITVPVDTRRKTLGVGPSISTNYANIKPIENPVYESANAYRRRVTSYASPTLPSKATANDSEDDVLERVETPFLSNFTRRLAQLKAEPLPGTDVGGTSSGGGYPATPKSKSTDYMTDYRYYGGSGARTNDRYRSGVQSSELKLQKSNSALAKWEQKLRWPLIILLSLFICIVVYVFFFSNY